MNWVKGNATSSLVSPSSPRPKCSQGTVPDLFPDSPGTSSLQISLTGRLCPGCHGVTLGWQSMAHLPGTLPGTSSSAGISPRYLIPLRLEGGQEPGAASHLPDSATPPP